MNIADRYSPRAMAWRSGGWDPRRVVFELRKRTEPEKKVLSCSSPSPGRLGISSFGVGACPGDFLAACADWNLGPVLGACVTRPSMSVTSGPLWSSVALLLLHSKNNVLGLFGSGSVTPHSASEMVVDIDKDYGSSLVNDVGSVDSLLDGIIQISSEGIERLRLVLAVVPIAPGDTITLGSNWIKELGIPGDIKLEI